MGKGKASAIRTESPKTSKKEQLKDVDNSNLVWANGLSVGLGGDIDQISNATLTAEERKIALKAYNTSSSNETIHANDSYPVWLIPVWILCASYSTYQIFTHPDVTAFMCCTVLIMTYFFIDLVSGVFHLVLDNPRFIGQAPIDGMCRGFQEHHLDPTLIFKMSLFEHLLPMGQPLVWTFMLSMPLEFIAGKTIPAFHAYFLCLSLFLIYMQLCHRWAHMPPKMRGPVVRFLQQSKLALAPGEHLKHHMAPYQQNFCIMNGMFNKFMNWWTSQPMFHPHSKIWAPMFAIVSYSPSLLCFLFR